jgi:hypothetical protein
VKGAVIEVNKRGMVAIRLDNDDFAIGEIPPQSRGFEGGDVVSGEFADLGGQSIRNATKQSDVRIMIHTARANGNSVNKLILLGPY